MKENVNKRAIVYSLIYKIFIQKQKIIGDPEKSMFIIVKHHLHSKFFILFRGLFF